MTILSFISVFLQFKHKNSIIIYQSIFADTYLILLSVLHVFILIGSHFKLR